MPSAMFIPKFRVRLLAAGVTVLLLASCGSDPAPTSQAPAPTPTAQGAPSTPPMNLKQVATGFWGGQGIRLEVVEGATSQVEFDCAHGTLAGPLQLGESNQFTSNGTYTPETGIIHEGQVPKTSPAFYAGEVFGDVMDLSVTYTPQDPSGEGGNTSLVTQNYRLHYRATLRLTKCL
ncbi:MAG: hypothetical protein H7222_14995 [Methylotenera sp.]|nr:hypothetical protein [Oligoflexia bacterium]